MTSALLGSHDNGHKQRVNPEQNIKKKNPTIRISCSRNYKINQAQTSPLEKEGHTDEEQEIPNLHHFKQHLHNLIHTPIISTRNPLPKRTNK